MRLMLLNGMCAIADAPVGLDQCETNSSGSLGMQGYHAPSSFEREQPCPDSIMPAYQV